MVNLELYAGETRHVLFTVTSSANPLADSVAVAFVPPRTAPIDTDWKPAEWVPDQTWDPDPDTGKGKAVARVLVGPDPGVVALLGGKEYDLVVKVVANPEQPWLKSGTVLVR